MKKKLIFIITIAAVIAICFSGCSDKNTEKIKNMSDLKGKVIGMLSGPVSAETYKDILAKEFGGAPKEVLFFNKATDMVAAIKAGKIDAAPCMKIEADYAIKRNNDLITIPQNEKGECSVLMVVRAEDINLKNELDSAITTLQENGTLKTLEDKWITNLSATNEISNIDIPKIEGAKTYYVGVFGDYAPLDYIAADGKPAGYNTALLAEIGKLLNINFEFISLESQAKFPALFSKKIDVVFCQFYANKIASLFASEKFKFLLTKPYYTSDGLHFLVRK
ncbi:MAG TPA: transporter substrate-binding domain-containing protein [bacterium]|nr:transporter substrate-binding domain-containing protein [bacterium]HPN30494.1 transporter substrate-binding domain-containing protein [bacterium]